MKFDKYVIAVDFDGTIVQHRYPEIGDTIDGALEGLSQLAMDGHYIVIWTCRVGKELLDVKNWLDSNGVIYDSINRNAGCVNFPTGPKIYYDILIDDRAWDCVIDWTKIVKDVRKKYEAEKI